MGVGAGLYMYDVVVKKFTFAISSPDEFLLFQQRMFGNNEASGIWTTLFMFIIKSQWIQGHAPAFPTTSAS